MKHIYLGLIFFFCLSYSFAQRCITYDYNLKQNIATQSYSPALRGTADAGRDTLANEIINIPVVIHVIYNSDIQNISDAQILSQLDVLNKDYRKANADAVNVPAAFAPLAADVRIHFCLAKTDPTGKPTTGIIRKHTNYPSWQPNDGMKYSSSSGDNAWDSKRYLNIWVCNLSGSELGYSSLPGGPADKDGVVIQYDVFGNTGTIRSPFDKGRTATHEIGHWLGLKHLWGDALCGDDGIADTPPQKTYNNGCPSFPHVSTCSINGYGDMFMNFMDFSNDACMNMFTQGQKNEMRSMFAIGGYRNSFLNSTACNSNSPEAGPLPVDTTTVVSTPKIISAVRLYPNPSVDVIFLESKNDKDLVGKTLKIYNVFGSEVLSQLLDGGKNKIQVNKLAKGLYIIRIGEGDEKMAMKFIKE